MCSGIGCKSFISGLRVEDRGGGWEGEGGEGKGKGEWWRKERGTEARDACLPLFRGVSFPRQYVSSKSAASFLGSPSHVLLPLPSATCVAHCVSVLHTRCMQPSSRLAPRCLLGGKRCGESARGGGDHRERTIPGLDGASPEIKRRSAGYPSHGARSFSTRAS